MKGRDYMGTKIDVVVAYKPIKVIVDNADMDSEQKLKMIDTLVSGVLEEAEK